MQDEDEWIIRLWSLTMFKSPASSCAVHWRFSILGPRTSDNCNIWIASRLESPFCWPKNWIERSLLYFLSLFMTIERANFECLVINWDRLHQSRRRRTDRTIRLERWESWSLHSSAQRTDLKATSIATIYEHWWEIFNDDQDERSSSTTTNVCDNGKETSFIHIDHRQGWFGHSRLSPIVSFVTDQRFVIDHFFLNREKNLSFDHQWLTKRNESPSLEDRLFILRSSVESLLDSEIQLMDGVRPRLPSTEKLSLHRHLSSVYVEFLPLSMASGFADLSTKILFTYFSDNEKKMVWKLDSGPIIFRLAASPHRLYHLHQWIKHSSRINPLIRDYRRPAE